MTPSTTKEYPTTGGLPTPPRSASPTKTSFPAVLNESQTPERSHSPKLHPARSCTIERPSTGNSQVQRRASLSARFPGDRSHRPLDVIRAEHKAADRRHKRRTIVGADIIDRLDMIGANGVLWHHDGPYDATLLARNLSFDSSPVAATRGTNEEALRATPSEYIENSIQRHQPLHGTAIIPPGMVDSQGRVMNFREGPNLSVEMAWRHQEGITNHLGDLKGKGEPTLTLDKARKHKVHRRIVSEGDIEMQDKAHMSTSSLAPLLGQTFWPEEDESMTGGATIKDMAETLEKGYSSDSEDFRHVHTNDKRPTAVASALKTRFGSLRRRNETNRNPPPKEAKAAQ